LGCTEEDWNKKNKKGSAVPGPERGQRQKGVKICRQQQGTIRIGPRTRCPTGMPKGVAIKVSRGFEEKGKKKNSPPKKKANGNKEGEKGYCVG